MKTANEISAAMLTEMLTEMPFVLSASVVPYLIEAIELGQKEAYNQAIEDAVKNAETIQASNSGNWLDAKVDTESILKLKK